MEQPTKKSPLYEEFKCFGQLYSKYNAVKEKYYKLYSEKRSGSEIRLESIEKSMKDNETKSESLTNDLNSEVKRWKGDRKYTSKELAEKLRKSEELCEEKMKELQTANNKILDQQKQIDRKNKINENLVEKINSVKHSMTEKHKEEINDVQMKHKNEIDQLEKKIKLLNYEINEEKEDKDYKNKSFRGKLAKTEYEWAEEKIKLEEKYKRKLKEVSHWNTEALKMENRVKQYEKKIHSLGIRFDCDDAETLKAESGYAALIRDFADSKEALEDAKSTILKLKEEKKDLIELSKSNGNIKASLESEKRIKCFALMTGIKIDPIDSNGEFRFNCRAINYKRTKMLDYEMRFDLKREIVTYQFLKSFDPNSNISEEFKNCMEIKMVFVPLLISRLLSVVNSEVTK